VKTTLKSLLILVVLLLSKISFCQNHPSDTTLKKIEWHELIGNEPSDKNHYLTKGHLETELEIYPFNIVLPADPVIKNEAMFDYHRYLKHERLLNARFFGDANTHWGGKSRNMKDLIMYTEIVYGLKHFQLGAEVGTVTGEEYMSIGPQYTTYDTKYFKRMALISRVLPDLVLGYEFTTKEFRFIKGSLLSSTGTSRVVFPKKQMVFQVSGWISFEKWQGVYIGIEYEHNNANSYNNIEFENHNDLFLGIKFELK
jgi:hypothetical protein